MNKYKSVDKAYQQIDYDGPMDNVSVDYFRTKCRNKYVIGYKG